MVPGEWVDGMDDSVVNRYSGILEVSRKGRKRMLEYQMIRPRLKTDWSSLVWDQ